MSVQMNKIPHLFKHNAEGKAIPELADPTMSWVLNGWGMPTYKLTGILVKVEEHGVGHYSVKVWDDKLDNFRSVDEQKEGYIVKAFLALPQKDTEEGLFVVYGKDVRGNPHKCEDTEMVCISPTNYDIWIPFLQAKKLRGEGGSATVQEVFEGCRKELLDPETEVDGVVFHREYGAKTVAVCQVERGEFD